MVFPKNKKSVGFMTHLYFVYIPNKGNKLKLTEF